jgi:hypothetical protein
MSTYAPYPIRLRPEERLMLKEVAKRMNRSQSETVRVLVRGALEVLREQEERSVKETRHDELAV